MTDAPCITLGASIACFRGGSVLLARRGRAPWRGRWSLPGGRIEPGETAAQAALRELAEETGAVAEIIGLADVVESIARDAEGRVESHVVILAHAGRWIAGEPGVSVEATELAWVAPEAVSRYDATPGLAAVVRRAAELAERPA